MAPINPASTYGAPTKPGTKTCRAFNDGMCLKAQDHHQWQHMCAFCLKTTNRAYQHSKTSCNRKKFQSQPKKRLRGVVTHSLSPDHGVFALSQMDAPDEKLDLPMDTKLTTLPTPHQRWAFLGSGSLLWSLDNMNSPQNPLHASQARPCACDFIPAPHVMSQPWACAGAPITPHIMVGGAPSIVLSFSSTWGMQTGKAFMDAPPAHLASLQAPPTWISGELRPPWE